MRLLVAALILLASVPALAQSQYASGPGAFVNLYSLGYSSTGRPWARGTVGYRLSDHADVGLWVGYKAGEWGRNVSVGPTVGLTQQIGRDWSARLEASARYGSVRLDGEPYGRESGMTTSSTTVSEDLTATVGRPLPLPGSFQMRPTIGVYATGRQALSLDAALERTPTVQEYAQVGLHLELPITFRILGTESAVTTAVRIGLAGEGTTTPGEYGAYSGMGLRVNL